MFTELEARVNRTPEGCWLWRGAINEFGYGMVWFEGRKILAHRFNYEKIKGPIPKGMVLDHLCRHRSCVSVDHLEAVTRAENNARRWIAQGRLFICKNGHPICDGNVYQWERNGRVQRRCRECALDRAKRQRMGERSLKGEERLLKRFFEKIEKADGCWNWIGSKTLSGYGRFSDGKLEIAAHRFAYVHFKRDILDELTVDHICKNRACVNPEHLRLLSREENSRCADHPIETCTNAQKIQCKRGHQLSGSNLAVRMRSDGGTYRACLKCHRLLVKRMEKICEWCGRKFEAPIHEVKRGGGRFCSHRCLGYANARYLPINRIDPGAAVRSLQA